MDKVLGDLQENFNIICSREFSKNDVWAFMVQLRSSLPTHLIDPTLLDLCNFFNHSEGRDQGKSSEFVELFLEQFIVACESNEKVTIPTPFFNKKEVISKILAHLEKIGLSVSRLDFVSSSDKFINYLLESVGGINYVIKNPKVKCCYIKYEKNDKHEAFLCFQLQNISPQAIVRRDGPGVTCVSIFYDGDKKLKPLEIFMR